MDQAGILGLVEKEYYKLKPREFERLYRGFVYREQLEWDRQRTLITTLININSPKGKGTTNEKLMYLDMLDKPLSIGPTEEHEKLRAFVNKLERKNGN